MQAEVEFAYSLLVLLAALTFKTQDVGGRTMLKLNSGDSKKP